MHFFPEIKECYLEPLEAYRQWLFSGRVMNSVFKKIKWPAPPLQNPEDSTATEELLKIDPATHRGTPSAQYGVNLNYRALKSYIQLVDPQFLDEIRVMNQVLDDGLQCQIGSRLCALKMFYPKNGYVAWHTNWDVPGYNVIFTYTKGGAGYWRHIDPKGATNSAPNPHRVVEIKDPPGWHCKMGYFGDKEDFANIVWHSAFASEPRLTVGYVTHDRALWENILEEFQSLKSTA